MAARVGDGRSETGLRCWDELDLASSRREKLLPARRMAAGGVT